MLLPRSNMAPIHRNILTPHLRIQRFVATHNQYPNRVLDGEKVERYAY